MLETYKCVVLYSRGQGLVITKALLPQHICLILQDIFLLICKLWRYMEIGIFLPSVPGCSLRIKSALLDGAVSLACWCIFRLKLSRNNTSCCAHIRSNHTCISARWLMASTVHQQRGLAPKPSGSSFRCQGNRQKRSIGSVRMWRGL